MATLTSEILADSPSGYWPMNELSGSTVYDLSGNARNGTITGGVTPHASGPGELRALAFDGATNTYVTVADNDAWSAAGGSGTITYEMWVYRSTNAQKSIMAKGLASGPQYEILGEITATGQARFDFVESGGATIVTVSGGAVILDAWNHVAVTYNRATPICKLYVNGVLVDTETSFGAGSMTNTTGPLYFGTRNDALGSSTYAWNGRLAQVATYTTVLSDARILAHCEAGVPLFTYAAAIRRTSGLVGYWPLNETSGTTANGYGAAGSGTYTNGPTLNQAGPTNTLTKSVDFDGTDDTMGLAANTNFDLATMSMECWYRSDAIGAEGIVLMASRNLTTGTTVRFSCSMPTAQDRMEAWNGTAAVNSGAASTNPVGSWHHYVWVWSGGTVAMYDNGVLLATPTLAMGSATNQVFHAGGMTIGGTNYQCNGRMAHVAVYNRALTAAEIGSHYVLGRAWDAANAPMVMG